MSASGRKDEISCVGVVTDAWLWWNTNSFHRTFHVGPSRSTVRRVCGMDKQDKAGLKITLLHASSRLRKLLSSLKPGTRPVADYMPDQFFQDCRCRAAQASHQQTSLTGFVLTRLSCGIVWHPVAFMLHSTNMICPITNGVGMKTLRRCLKHCPFCFGQILMRLSQLRQVLLVSDCSEARGQFSFGGDSQNAPDVLGSKPVRATRQSLKVTSRMLPQLKLLANRHSLQQCRMPANMTRT